MGKHQVGVKGMHSGLERHVGVEVIAGRVVMRMEVGSAVIVGRVMGLPAVLKGRVVAGLEQMASLVTIVNAAVNEVVDQWPNEA
jgi:hypothetical protein